MTAIGAGLSGSTGGLVTGLFMAPLVEGIMIKDLITGDVYLPMLL